MLLLIPLLPFLGFLVNASAGRRLTKTVSGAVAVGAIGKSLFTDYAFPFEVTSVLILVAMVGAVVLARREES